MANNNQSLQRAAKAKADEFYTQLSDIEAELRHYKDHFKGKKILCNCDDPFESNFFKYFAMNFNYLGLAKLTATSYAESPIAEGQLPLFEVQGLGVKQGEGKKPYKIEITEVIDEDGNQAIDLADVEYLLKNQRNALSLLEGDGDFRSRECIELLKEADIVVTNPPFSLFREYVAQLVKFDKKFVIIGSKNAITYKDIFSLIKQNLVWLGNGFPNGNAFFTIPSQYAREWADGVYDPKTGTVKFRNVGWFTNLDFSKRHETLTLYRRYVPDEYPHYDNYDAINVDKVSEIPDNYDGVMGVPITFLDKYNPEQFQILGITDRQNTSNLRTKKYTIEEAPNYNDLNVRGVLNVNGKYQSIYARILIRRKQVGQ